MLRTLTLALLLLLPTALVAQEPPRPVRPARPPRPAPAAPTPAPAPAPRALRGSADLTWELDRMRWELDVAAIEMARNLDHVRIADEARLAASAAMLDIDHVRIAEEARAAARAVRVDLDVDRIARDAERVSHDAMRDAARAMRDSWRVDGFVTPAPMAPLAPMTPLPPFPRSLEPPRGLASMPPAPWAQEDPADSLYRQARETMNRGEYRRAAQLFAQLQQRFPGSRYASDAPYWQAFSLYRIGGSAELRQALEALNTQQAKYPSARTQEDASTLRTRILGALASRGDAAAQREIERIAQQGGTSCDQEDQQVRAEALAALTRTDPAGSSEALRQVLARRDPCSVTLRKRAVYLLGEREEGANVQALTDVARNDPDPEVRDAAMEFMGRRGDDRSVQVLEEILRTSNDERTQRTAARALARSPNPKARQATRALIERNDVSVNLRREAISAYARGERASPEDAAYLRGLYAKVEDPRLKSSIVAAVLRTELPENDAWLMQLAGNENEPSEARQYALSALASSRTPIATVTRAYDTVSDRRLREQLVSVLGKRPEPEATDKLLEIAKTGTDPNIRRMAIHALSNKKDPRTTKLLMELLSK